MKKLALAFLMLSCLTYIIDCNAQDFGCPLEEGKVPFKNHGIYSHSDPTHSTTIISPKNDNVRASLQGQVLDILKSPENLYTVIVRSGEIIIAYKYLQIAAVTKHQIVEIGYILGNAQSADSGGYSLDVAIWFGSKGIDASELLSCAK